MSHKLFVCLAAALVFAAAGPGQTPPKKSALDKAQMEAYVRHLFVMDSRINIQVLDPKPSTELPGFNEVTIHAWSGPQSQDFTFFVSKDGSRIFQTTVYDFTNNPFKRDLDKLKTASMPNFGTPGAPVVLVEFSDFQCPYCKEEAKMLRDNLLTTYPKQVRLYFNEFPLESLHPWARAAAIAGRCVYRQNANAFWSYHDWIFAHQADITPDNLKDKVLEWAKGEKEIDALQLGRCIDAKESNPDVERSIAQGKELHIDRTPTLFINGRRVDQVVDWPTLRSIIDYEIDYQKTAKDAGEDCGCELKLNLPGQKTTSPADLLKKK
jgi:protein-disulfide isomerase